MASSTEGVLAEDCFATPWSSAATPLAATYSLVADLWSLQQEDCEELQDSLGYTVRSCLKNKRWCVYLSYTQKAEAGRSEFSASSSRSAWAKQWDLVSNIKQS